MLCSGPLDDQRIPKIFSGRVWRPAIRCPKTFCPRHVFIPGRTWVLSGRLALITFKAAFLRLRLLPLVIGPSFFLFVLNTD